jgi:hypothetical protein
MKISSDDLRQLFKSYIREKIPKSEETCPSPEIISSLFFQASAEEQKTEIIDHVTHCSRCLEVFEFCLEISRSENWLSTEIGTRVKSAKKKRPAIFKLPKRAVAHPWWKSGLIPLTATILVTITIITTRHISINKGRDNRGRPPGPVYLLSPLSDISSRIPLTFKWSSGIKTQFAFLEIFNETLLPVWKSPKIFGESYELPPEARIKIKRAKTYFWMVTIFLPDGTEIESALKRFSISE